MSEFQSSNAFPSSTFTDNFKPLVRSGFRSVFPVMSEHESRRFWCFLEGRRTVCYISDIPLDANVNRVKAEIKGRIDALQGIDADRLILRKFNKPVRVDPDSNLAKRVADLGDISTYSQELSDAEKVGELFPEPHSLKHLHILVLIPPSASRKHFLGDEDGQKAKRQKFDPDLAWLVELHSNIWKGGDECLKMLVHEVEVTVAHYRELQRRLKTRQNRDSNEDIIAIKREILLHYNTTPGNEANVSEESGDDDPEFESNSDTSDNEQDPANVSEESGDDDTELGSFLPATFKFLDLSSLELKHKTSRLPLPLFVRPEYTIIFDEIQASDDSHIISGQPGTGKTAFLHYMMIKYMLDGTPFIYQSMRGIVYYVSKKVEIIESWDPSRDIVVAFVDGTESSQHIPKGFLQYQSVQFILASSPKGASPRWPKQLGRSMRTWIVELWTACEFFVTGIFLHPYHLDFARLWKSASFFGHNPRRSFEASKSQDHFERYQAEVIHKISNIDQNVSLGALMRGASSGTQHHPVSHVVFEVFPENEKRLLTQAHVKAVSKWALSQLLKEYNRRRASAAADFYRTITGISSAGSLRDEIFELRVLEYLDTIEQPMTFKIRKLTTLEKLDWCYPGPAPRCDFKKQELTTVLKEIVQQKRPRHLVPLTPNYAAVDSILYDPKSVLTGLQVTITKSHPIAVSGLKTIQQSLKCNTSLANLRPSTPEAKHWRFIFVVPEEDADSFTFQTFNGDTANNAWAQKIDQYVLGLNVDTVFAN